MKKPLRALLLAAGFGTRLRPLTLTKPKCLVDLAGKPLLGHWLEKLEKAGCESTVVNSHYLSNQVADYLKNWRSSTMNVSIFNEPKLLGTAGTLIANETFFNGTTGLLIHADNAMSDNLDEFLHAHQNREEECLLTMLTFETDTPRSCGIVETDRTGRLIDFHEKVEDPPGNQANGAVYAFDEELFMHINKIKPQPCDFSTEIIPTILGRTQTWQTKQTFMDIGNPVALKKAQTIWREKTS